MDQDVERTVFIEAGPAVVFEALTSPELVTRWLCHEAQIEAKEGGRYGMAWNATDRGRTARYEGSGRIEIFAPGSKLALHMLDGPQGEPGTLVSFELSPQGAGTNLVLKHEGFGPSPEGRRKRLGYERGWGSCLDLLRSLLEDQPGQRLLMAAMHRDLPVPGDEPCGLAWDGTKLWLSESSNGKIYQVDPDTGRVLGSIPYDGEPADLTWDGTHLWQADTDKRALVKLDPHTGRIAATLRVPRDSGELAGLAWDGKGLWVSLSGEQGLLLRLDARTGALTATRPASPSVSGLAWDGEMLWAGDFKERTVARVDPTTGSVLSRFAAKGRPTGLAWDGERVWYVDREWRLVSRILDAPPSVT